MLKPSGETMAAWSALLLAHRRLTAALDQDLRTRAGIGLEDYDVLYQIRSAGEPLRMTQLAERVLVSRPTASRVVDRLVARGWIRRWHDDADRRVVLLELTPEGKRRQAGAGRIHVDGIARWVEAPLAGRDLSALRRSLQVLAGEPAPDGDAS
jgi:DNA-binding MarR family transcriptional regulator